MPIHVDQLDRYPDDWPAISYDARVRAEWRCECHGECGRVNSHLAPGDGRCRNQQGMPAWGSGTLVHLQTGHRNHIPEDCRPENLAAWCPGCHLEHDRAHHAATRRARELAAMGMEPLFALDPVVVVLAGVR